MLEKHSFKREIKWSLNFNTKNKNKGGHHFKFLNEGERVMFGSVDELNSEDLRLAKKLSAVDKKTLVI